MTVREVISVMLDSPLYLEIPVSERLGLIKEFCSLVLDMKGFCMNAKLCN